jgi:hypothetical protein
LDPTCSHLAVGTTDGTGTESTVTLLSYPEMSYIWKWESRDSAKDGELVDIDFNTDGSTVSVVLSHVHLARLIRSVIARHHYYHCYKHLSDRARSVRESIYRVSDFISIYTNHWKRPYRFQVGQVSITFLSRIHFHLMNLNATDSHEMRPESRPYMRS